MDMHVGVVLATRSWLLALICGRPLRSRILRCGYDTSMIGCHGPHRPIVLAGKMATERTVSLKALVVLLIKLITG